MDPTLVAAAVAFGISYVVGALPVTWLLTRRRPRTGLRGVRAVVAAGVLECFKGAAVAIAAGLYSRSGWFIATAVAGCVAGDAFPPLLRRGGRGLLPLITAFFVSLPTAGVITAIIALPTALLTAARGRIYDTAVTIAVPGGLLLGTRDVRSLAPAGIIVLVLVARHRLRLRQRRDALVQGGGWRNLVIDADQDPTAATSRPHTAPARQNRSPWDS